MDFINHEKQDMADALEVCVQNCANDLEFVAEFNRLTGCNFPHGGEPEMKIFVDFVGQSVFIPLVSQYLEHLDDQEAAS